MHDGRLVRIAGLAEDVLQRSLRLFDQQDRRVEDLGEIVRRNVGGHAHGDSVGAVNQQRGDARGQHGRLDGGVVEVGGEVYRVLVDVGQQLGGNCRKPSLGVAVGRRRIAIHRAEVALAVHEPVAQRKVLRHAHQRVIDRTVAVRVILAQHLAHNLGALDVLAVGQQPHIVHGVQDAPMHRLEAVADIGQGAADDDRHRIVEIRPAHLLFNVDRLNVLRRTAAAFQRKPWFVDFVCHKVFSFSSGIRGKQSSMVLRPGPRIAGSLASLGGTLSAF